MKFNEIDFSIKNILIFSGLIVLLGLLYATRDIIILFIISVLIAYLINPLVVFFEKVKIPRFLGVLIIVVALVIILTGLLALTIPILIKDITYLISNLPEYINNFFNWVEIKMKEYNVDSKSFDIETSKQFILERIGVISKYVLNTISQAAASVKDIASVLINVFIVPVLVFFLLTDFPNFKMFTNKVVEEFKMQKIMEHLSQFEHLVGKYFRGMFLVGLILSCLYGLVLFIVGTKGWLFLGILTGFGAMIPYIGFTVGLISSIIATIFTFHDVIHPIYAILGFIVVQILESMIITPKIVGDSLGISPVVVIVALMLGGALAGFIGMLIALPMAAFVKLLIDQYIFKKDLTKKNTNDIVKDDKIDNGNN